MPAIQKQTLLCAEGGANKQYTLWIEPQGNGFVVQTQWGPRGGWVQSACKTPAPVPMDKAQKVYDKLVKEKQAKGYHAGKDAPAFSQVAGAVDTGLRPMLLTPASEDDLERFITDDAWGAQEKLNGKRIMLRSTVAGPVGVNRRGLECPIPESVRAAFRKVPGIFDGELIGDVYHAFDALEVDGEDFSRCGYVHRHAALRGAVGGRSPVVETATTTRDKRALVERLRRGRKEGVVFKKLDAPYEPGRREDLKKAIAVKIKFYADGAFTILKWNDKSSIEVAASGGTSVGNVTVPAKYKDQIKAGSVVRVRYLYATAADKLYQAHLDPTSDGKVVDDHAEADPLSSLKYEGKEED